MKPFIPQGFSESPCHPWDGAISEDDTLEESVFVHSPYAAMLVDVNGTMLNCNTRAAKSLFGVSASRRTSLIGAHLSSMTQETEEEVIQMLRQGVASGAVTYQIRHYSATKRPTRIRFRAMLLPGTAKRARCALLTQDHLHDSALMMARLNQSRIETKNALTEMTKRSTDLSEALKTMEIFTNAASHDLRGPLGNLQMMLETFERKYGGNLPENGNAYLNKIRSVSDTLQVLTVGLLEHAQTSASEMTLKRLDVKTVAQNVRQGFEMELKACGGTVQITGDATEILADAALFQTILVNLIGNAIKYRVEGRPLQIEIECKTLDKEQTRLTITDNGRGFDRGAAQKIFEPFQRLEPGVPGLGVGLATCANICRRHGWDIQASGSPGIGATFVLTV